MVATARNVNHLLPCLKQEEEEEKEEEAEEEEEEEEVKMVSKCQNFKQELIELVQQLCDGLCPYNKAAIVTY